MRRIGNFGQVIVALLTGQIFIMSHNTEVLNTSNGGEISASCVDLLIIKIQTARRNLMTVINSCDAPIRKPLRLLHQKLGRALIWPTPTFNTRFKGRLSPSLIPGQGHTKDSRRGTRLPSILDIRRSAGRVPHRA
jgi:hypothetical protein